MNLQDENKKFSDKLDQLQTAITEIEDDFNFKMLRNTDPASETGKKLETQVLTTLNTWRKSYNLLLQVLTRAEDYQSKGATTDALSELTGPRSRLGNISAMNLLDEILKKVTPQKADILDFLADISDAMTAVSNVFQELKGPLESAMKQYPYALSAVPDAPALMTLLKESETRLLADPIGFKPDSSGITTLRDRVRNVKSQLEQNGKRLADAPLLKANCTALLDQLAQSLSAAQKAVRGANVMCAPIPTLREYTELVKRGKTALKALETVQIADINGALLWQSEAQATLDRIEATVTGIETSKIKLDQIRAKFRSLRDTKTKYGLNDDPELMKIEADARDILAREPVDVTTFEQLVGSFSTKLRDLRRSFS